MLDSLVEVVPVGNTPIVNLAPAPVWGMSKWAELRSMLAREDDVEPCGHYDPATKSIDIKVGQDMVEANHLLLSGTRRWAGHLNGELAAAQKLEWQHRYSRRLALAGFVGAGGIEGYNLGKGVGAIVGGALGVIADLSTQIAIDAREPYRRSVRNFLKDPEVLSEYGRVLSYESI